MAESGSLASTGVKGLDDVLSGGLTRTRLYLVEGTPGSGKTTLALQFLMAGAKDGEPVLYVTLSETAEELRAVAESHGWSLDGIEIRELTPTEGVLDPEEQNTMFHPSETELASTTQRSEIGTAITEVLPHIFQYAQQHGIALSGHPFTRYAEVGAGLITIEPGMRVVGPLAAEAADSRRAAATGGVVEDVLPAGPAAVTTHMGPYDTLSEAYGAIETWMAAEGQAAAGAPWESYITDPAEHPDPKDWKTEVAWPLQ